ncbi:MAG: TlpA disulfide reductase family protein [Acidovorax sp.]|uniref:TlpA family protein disulfide reductase n=1 Tax=Acidovorax sp. TaxID=1872122 RepID=UPI0039E6B5E7
MNLKSAVLFLSVLIVQIPAVAFKPEIGEVPAPLDKLEYVDGSAIDLRALIGKPVVLYFGADWCPPCVERGRPTLLTVANKYGPLGLQVVYVNRDDNRYRSEKVEEAAKLGVRIAMSRMSLCPPGQCPRGWRDLGPFGIVYQIPSAIVLDSNGVVRAKLERGMGVQAGLDSAVREVMKSAGLLVER